YSSGRRARCRAWPASGSRPGALAIRHVRRAGSDWVFIPNAPPGTVRTESRGKEWWWEGLVVARTGGGKGGAWEGGGVGRAGRGEGWWRGGLGGGRGGGGRGGVGGGRGRGREDGPGAAPRRAGV